MASASTAGDKSGQAIYNTAVGVVANIRASCEREAVNLLSAALTRAGFDPYEGSVQEGGSAFEADDGTEAGGLPDWPARGAV